MTQQSPVIEAVELSGVRRTEAQWAEYYRLLARDRALADIAVAQLNARWAANSAEYWRKRDLERASK